jgi:phospholipid transport system substrate-binding protein
MPWATPLLRFGRDGGAGEMIGLLNLARRLALVLPMVLGAQDLLAAPAKSVVDSFHQTLLAVMKDADKLGFAGRYQRVDPAVRAAFDLPHMTRLTIGADWAKLAPAQQEKAIDVFSRWTATNYASRFDGYSGERFEIMGERPTQGATIVQTRLVKPQGEPVLLNYLMREAADGWRINDIYLSGTISELAVRRSEFASILKRDGFDGLVETIEKRIAEMKAK